MQHRIRTADDLLNIYAQGCFPMAHHGDDTDFFIVDPEVRSLLPLAHLHIPKSLRKLVLKFEFDVKIDTAFSAVLDACAEPTQVRPDTWINPSIKKLFNDLHAMGHAHSVECWRDDKLVGGLYGLQLGAAFCGESMFSRETNASKVALVHLCARLSAADFTLLDAQFENPHLDQFGQMSVPRVVYLHMLEAARQNNRDFTFKTSEAVLVKNYITDLSIK